MVEFVSAEETAQEASNAHEFLRVRRELMQSQAAAMLARWGNDPVRKRTVLDLYTGLWRIAVESAEQRFGKPAVAYVLGFCLH